ncbi:MAG: IS30 family transposase, partial [Parcubacteria group bacterium]
TDFATISDERIREIERRLNTRPRKRLGWKTPQEVFNKRVALKC